MNGLEAMIARKTYPAVGSAKPLMVFRDFRLSVPTGQFVAIAGPSGCGKTTLLNLIAGLDREFQGKIRLPVRRRRDAKPVIGYMFQTPRLLPWRTVAENLALVLPDRPERKDVVARWLKMVGLSGQGDVYPGRLSLGMARRVALARAFAVEPTLLLMDEPFVSLDHGTAQWLRELLSDIWTARPTTVLLVTHDLREAITLADRIVLLSSPPAQVVADVVVPLARDRRWDEAAVEDVRRRLDLQPGFLSGPALGHGSEVGNCVPDHRKTDDGEGGRIGEGDCRCSGYGGAGRPR